ncbi:MAG TPA: DUF3332 domain-containing protein [bacterium]|nr:DUF3332 domain-containing protein [bacterium]HNB11142.1 DUF3332 domain-containing protein [bacterium]HNB55655.1 DUF3332 domain-containing protein [bacterium]HNC47362.1 DUF3332 domain-containing protein [bacterium]HND76297.1 DUF3332 domain-containing protein [bacterium]
MRKYTKVIALTLAVLMGSISVSSCYGKFALTRKLYTWNGSVTGNKFVNNLVFWALLIIPVYSIAGFVDAILNTVEFWTGSNPMAMKEGEKEVKQFAHEGNTFEVTATKNRLQIVQLTGEQAGASTVLVFRPESKSWYAETAEGAYKIASITDENNANFVNPFAAK